MPKQKVGAGESTASIAKANGFFYKTLWDHPENAALKAKRKDPNVLFEDDEFFVPEKQLKEVSKGTEAEHTFKKKGEPCKIKLQLLEFDKPRANEDYVCEIDGKLTSGKTDGEGIIEQFISPHAKSGKILLRGGKEVIGLNLDALDPIDLPSGVQQRLNNLGFPCGGEMGEIGEKTKEALRNFQANYELNASGEPDDATKNKLRELCK
jgi:hypothetical protein